MTKASILKATHPSSPGDRGSAMRYRELGPRMGGDIKGKNLEVVGWSGVCDVWFRGYRVFISQDGETGVESALP